MTTNGIYHTLVTQLDKLARHNRQGSFRTKDRYYEAVKRFCAYLAVHYHLQKLENISGKHLVSYVLYLQEQGKSASTIKTDLSAIRFFHDKMSHPRYTLPGNEELGVALERRRFGQQDRTWTNPEFGKLIGRAMAEEREDYILALYLARYAGFRIHECFRIDTAAVPHRGIAGDLAAVDGHVCVCGIGPDINTGAAAAPDHTVKDVSRTRHDAHVRRRDLRKQPWRAGRRHQGKRKL